MNPDDDKPERMSGSSFQVLDPICSGSDIRAALAMLGVDCERVRTVVFDAQSCTMLVYNGDGSHGVYAIASWR